MSEELVELILAYCSAHQIKFAGAESCSGGLVSSRITSVAGASKSFLGSVVCYTDMAKQALLQVQNALLVREGAVSLPVTKALLQGVLVQFDCELAFAVTGFAGPAGPNDNHPVGTVFIGTQRRQQEAQITQFMFEGHRQDIMLQAANQVLVELSARCRTE